MTTIRCPECQSLSQEDAIACERCGLLFLHRDAPRRRQEDFVVRGRRASDQALQPCPWCLAKIEEEAVRCRHCGEIVDEEFRRAEARKRREKINYASWVAYVFGLVTLLLFKPVGLISIGAGLLLSILYYAIPSEGLDRAIAGESRFRRWKRSLRSQMKFEKVTMPMPAFRKAKIVFIGTPVLATIIGYLANFLLLQQPMNEILKGNTAFAGMTVSAHYEYWIVPGAVVYDLKGLGSESTPLEVHTAFLEYARKMQSRDFERVSLRWQGDERFSLDGENFRRAGAEYAQQNFAWVLFDLPRLFQPVKGAQADDDTAQADALMDFHRRWYASDLGAAPAAN